MESRRQLKIANVLQQDLGEIFQQESRNLFGGAFITVTQVRVTPDLSYAKIFVSILNPDKEEVLKLINISNKEIRKRVASRVRHQMRKVPEMKFIIDDSLEYAQKINDLLK